MQMSHLFKRAQNGDRRSFTTLVSLATLGGPTLSWLALALSGRACAVPSARRLYNNKQRRLVGAPLTMATKNMLVNQYHGRRSVGDGGGTRPPPTFQLGGDHLGNVPPPLFCLKSRKYHVCSSSSSLHSFVRLRNRHMLVEIASGHVPHPVPHRSTRMDAW